MSKTYRLLSHILAVVLMCLAVNAFGANKDEMKSLSIIVKPAGKPSVSSIQFVVELVNNTDTTLDIITSGKTLPFTVKVIDKSGEDIVSNEITSITTGTTGNIPKSVHLIFAPRETKAYSVTVAEYKDEKGNKHKVPPGIYRITALLPIVSYVRSEAKVILRESNPVDITVR